MLVIQQLAQHCAAVSTALCSFLFLCNGELHLHKETKVNNILMFQLKNLPSFVSSAGVHVCLELIT